MIGVRLRLRGWTYSEPARRRLGPSPWRVGAGLAANLSRGLAGERRGAGRTHDMLRSTCALLRPGIQSRPQVVRPLTPQRGETCRSTLPIGTLAEGRHTHTQHTP